MDVVEVEVVDVLVVPVVVVVVGNNVVLLSVSFEMLKLDRSSSSPRIVKISSTVPLEMLLTFSSVKVMVVDAIVIVVVTVEVDVDEEVVDVVLVAVIGQIDGFQDPPPTNNVS